MLPVRLVARGRFFGVLRRAGDFENLGSVSNSASWRIRATSDRNWYRALVPASCSSSFGHWKISSKRASNWVWLRPVPARKRALDAPYRGHSRMICLVFSNGAWHPTQWCRCLPPSTLCRCRRSPHPCLSYIYIFFPRPNPRGAGLVMKKSMPNAGWCCL